MIIITGHIVAKPERLQEALGLGIEHSARSRAEPGCIAHNCHVDAEDPNRIVFVEEWADMDAVKAHFRVPASGEFVQKLSALSEETPQMRIYDAVEQRR